MTGGNVYDVKLTCITVYRRKEKYTKVKRSLVTIFTVATYKSWIHLAKPVTCTNIFLELKRSRKARWPVMQGNCRVHGLFHLLLCAAGCVEICTTRNKKTTSLLTGILEAKLGSNAQIHRFSNVTCVTSFNMTCRRMSLPLIHPVVLHNVYSDVVFMFVEWRFHWCQMV